MRRLANDEKLLWARVVATVKPLRRTVPPAHHEPPEQPRVASGPSATKARQPDRVAPHHPQPRVGGLDGGWDRRLARGLVRPDLVIDLHGHNLATAHDTLDRRLEGAIAAGARLILLITGKPPHDDRFPIVRGAIRASIDAWLHGSRHAPAIAAVRSAHPRHGGAGALYLVLKRSRSAC